MKKKLIIVEGPDAAGKSTIVDTLKTRLTSRTGRPILSLHFSAPTIEHWGAQNYGALSMMDYLYEDIIIIDRFHWSEIVYGRVLRKKSYFDEYPGVYDLILRRLREFVTYMIFVLPPFDKVNARYVSKFPDEYKKEQYKQLYIQYQQVFAQHHTELPYIRIVDTFSAASAQTNIDTILAFDKRVDADLRGISRGDV